MALVTILSTEGSSPRESGARMVVQKNGFHGTIGGGALEWQALLDARSALSRLRKAILRKTLALGPGLGQCCGGRVSLLTEVFLREDIKDIEALAEAEKQGPFFCQSRFDGDRAVSRTILPSVTQPDRQSATIDFQADGSFVEPWGDFQTPLLLFGAGHVGRALVLSLAPLPFAIRWIDSRAEAFPSHAPASATMVLSADPLLELSHAAAHSFVLIMTHSHALDFDLAALALKQDNFDYVGLIGSETKRASFSRKALAQGLHESALSRLVCPIGIPGISSKEPPSLAVGIAAQLLIRREKLLAGKVKQKVPNS